MHRYRQVATLCSLMRPTSTVERWRIAANETEKAHELIINHECQRSRPDYGLTHNLGPGVRMSRNRREPKRPDQKVVNYISDTWRAVSPEE